MGRVMVDFLANHTVHVETVARWIFDEWDHVTLPDMEAERAVVRARLRDDRVPLSLIALDGDQCVGTVSLYVDDLSSRPDLTPWLAALYVPPAHRNRGIGGMLVQEVVDVARRLGVRRLYLHTETASGFYVSRGWRLLFRTVNDRAEQTEVFDLILDSGVAFDAET